MNPASAPLVIAAPVATSAPSSPEEPVAPAPSFEAVYDAHADFIWRSARRLGVSEDAIDDVLQQVLLVLHRRLADYDGRTTMKTWIFGMLRRVIADHRRHVRRRSAHQGGAGVWIDPEALAAPASADPYERMAKEEASALVQRLLDELDDDRREVFVLAELEQMTAPEIAEATSTNVNTVYTRLRAARLDFEKAVARHHARARTRP